MSLVSHLAWQIISFSLSRLISVRTLLLYQSVLSVSLSLSISLSLSFSLSLFLCLSISLCNDTLYHVTLRHDATRIPSLHLSHPYSRLCSPHLFPLLSPFIHSLIVSLLPVYKDIDRFVLARVPEQFKREGEGDCAHSALVQWTKQETVAKWCVYWFYLHSTHT